MKTIYTILSALLFCLIGFALPAKIVDEAVISEKVIPPYSLGPATDIEGVWELLNGSGLQDGYVIQSENLAALPGFSGGAINLMIMIDMDGTFIDVKLLNQSEPIFVSGLGVAPFNQFLEQYRGHSITDNMTIGTNYGRATGGSSLIYLDGVTKATASVRIAHESIMAATREVAKSKLKGLVSAQSSASPKADYEETLSWQDLVDQELAVHFTMTNAEIQKRFEGTIWEYDDPEAIDHPDDLYIDLWMVDIGPTSIAKAVLTERSFDDLAAQLEREPSDEPILLIENARHGLVSDDFVPNTSPDWITASQDDLPIALRDSDRLTETLPDVPEGKTMILRTDRRLGFDPTRPWQLNLLAVRNHGVFQPEKGQEIVAIDYQSDPRFFDVITPQEPLPAWLDAIVNRWLDIAILGVFLLLVGWVMLRQNQISAHPRFTLIRLGLLAFTLGFVGWYGQGQLSIVTPLAVISGIKSGKSLEFLLYDPFSLLIWIFAIIGFFIWGRALFCGWLCPFGAFQELLSKAGEALRIKPRKLPAALDQTLIQFKYILLIALIAIAFVRPENIDKAAEVEPFKTAISVFFVRNWYFVAYALLCLFSSLFVYKAYCKYLCPLGALMAVGGLFRGKDWIKRREECGSPCQLCRVRCPYNAIKPTGKIQYSECFGCLDCVGIFNNPKECVPLVLAAKRKKS